MSKEVDDLFRKAMNLSIEDRATLSGKLMASLAKECKTDPEGKWRDGMLGRLANGDSNAGRLIEWEDAKRRARQRQV